MTNAEKILKALRLGKNVIVKSEDEEYGIFYIKEGKIICSVWGDNIEYCKEDMFGGYWTEEEIEKENFKYISCYSEFPQETFKEGDKVIIDEKIKDTENWTGYEKYFPNMMGIIKKIFNAKQGLHYGVTGNNGQSYCISHQYLHPDFEEENPLKDVPNETLIKEVESRGLLEDRKVIK